MTQNIQPIPMEQPRIEQEREAVGPQQQANLQNQQLAQLMQQVTQMQERIAQLEQRDASKELRLVQQQQTITAQNERIQALTARTEITEQANELYTYIEATDMSEHHFTEHTFLIDSVSTMSESELNRVLREVERRTHAHVKPSPSRDVMQSRFTTLRTQIQECRRMEAAIRVVDSLQALDADDIRPLLLKGQVPAYINRLSSQRASNAEWQIGASIYTPFVQNLNSLQNASFEFAPNVFFTLTADERRIAKKLRSDFVRGDFVRQILFDSIILIEDWLENNISTDLPNIMGQGYPHKDIVKEAFRIKKQQYQNDNARMSRLNAAEKFYTHAQALRCSANNRSFLDYARLNNTPQLRELTASVLPYMQLTGLNQYNTLMNNLFSYKDAIRTNNGEEMNRKLRIILGDIRNISHSDPALEAALVRDCLTILKEQFQEEQFRAVFSGAAEIATLSMLYFHKKDQVGEYARGMSNPDRIQDLRPKYFICEHLLANLHSTATTAVQNIDPSQIQTVLQEATTLHPNGRAFIESLVPSARYTVNVQHYTQVSVDSALRGRSPASLQVEPPPQPSAELRNNILQALGITTPPPANADFNTISSMFLRALPPSDLSTLEGLFRPYADFSIDRVKESLKKYYISYCSREGSVAPTEEQITQYVNFYLAPSYHMRLADSMTMRYCGPDIDILDMWVIEILSIPFNTLWSQFGRDFPINQTELLEQHKREVRQAHPSLSNEEVERRAQGRLELGYQKYLKDALGTLLRRIRNREAFAGTPPPETEALGIYYTDLKNGLLSIMHTINNLGPTPQAQERRDHFITELLRAAQYCGPRIEETVQDCYSEIVQGIVPTFENRIYKILDQYRIRLLETLAPPGPQSVHYVTSARRTIGQELGIFGAARAAQLGADPFAHLGGEVVRIRDVARFHARYTPHAIHEELSFELNQDYRLRNDAIQWLADHIPSNWTSQRVEQARARIGALRNEGRNETQIRASLESEFQITIRPQRTLEQAIAANHPGKTALAALKQALPLISRPRSGESEAATQERVRQYVANRGFSIASNQTIQEALAAREQVIQQEINTMLTQVQALRSQGKNDGKNDMTIAGEIHIDFDPGQTIEEGLAEARRYEYMEREILEPTTEREERTRIKPQQVYRLLEGLQPWPILQPRAHS